MIVVRAARLEDAAGIARVHVDSWRTTYAGIMPEKVLADLAYAQRERLALAQINAAAEGKRVVFVAEDSAITDPSQGAPAIVGFASGGPARQDAPGFDAKR
jgi:hypothetical protein